MNAGAAHYSLMSSGLVASAYPAYDQVFSALRLKHASWVNQSG